MCDCRGFVMNFYGSLMILFLLIPAIVKATTAAKIETTSISPTMSMPPVNVSKTGITKNCLKSRCTYTLLAPDLTKEFIDKEALLIRTETDSLNTWTMNISKFKKMNNLNTYRQEAEKLLQAIQNTKALIAQLKQTVSTMGVERQNADQSLSKVIQIVEIFHGELSSCYYKACLRPPPPPTTTTTTTTPTTTPDPCQSKNCTDYGKCIVKNGQAVCACSGNLGSARDCHTSTCANPGTAQPLSADDKAIIVSPGYFWDASPTIPQPQYYNASICQWIITVQPWETLEVDADDNAPVAFNVSNMGGARMLWEGDPGSQYQIGPTTKLKYLNSAMNLTAGTRHTFTLKATGMQSAFSFGFTLKKKIYTVGAPKEQTNIAHSILKWLGF